MPSLESGFYWTKNIYGNNSLVYYNLSPVYEDESVLASLFDERGIYGTVMTNVKRLVPFNPEKDMKKLKPEVANRVRQKLEEIANEG